MSGREESFWDNNTRFFQKNGFITVTRCIRALAGQNFVNELILFRANLTYGPTQKIPMVEKRALLHGSHFSLFSTNFWAVKST